MGTLPSTDFPTTVDGIDLFMCMNEDCTRFGLMTPVAKPKN